MNKIKKLLMGLVLGLGLVTMCQGPAQAYVCVQWDITLNCLRYSVDLLPNARWCNGNPTPGAREATIYIETNYADVNHWCQVVPVAVGAQLPITNLSAYDLDGPSWNIQSIWLGSNLSGYFWNNNGYGGSYKLLGTPVGYPYYENSVTARWGWSISSFNLF